MLDAAENRTKGITSSENDVDRMPQTACIKLVERQVVHKVLDLRSARVAGRVHKSRDV